MDLPPALDSELFLEEIIEAIAIDASSPEEANRMAAELLKFLNEKLKQFDWKAELDDRN